MQVPNKYLTARLQCSPEEKARLGRAAYEEYGQAVAGYTTAMPKPFWRCLSKLSAYAAGNFGTGVGRATPRLEPFMFIQRSLESAPRLVKRELLDSDVPHSFVAVEGLYAYTLQADLISVNGFCKLGINSSIHFVNQRVEAIKGGS